MKKIHYYTILIVFVTSVAFTGTASAYTLSLADASGNPGDTISVDLFLSLEDGEQLQSADFDVAYDDGSLKYTGLTWSSYIDSAAFYNVTFPEETVPPITFSLMFLDPQVGSAQQLVATIDFLILDSGTAGITYTDAYLENVTLYDPAGDPADVVVQDALITINGDNAVVPEPSTMLLCGAGIACLFACCRRKS